MMRPHPNHQSQTHHRANEESWASYGLLSSFNPGASAHLTERGARYPGVERVNSCSPLQFSRVLPDKRSTRRNEVQLHISGQATDQDLAGG